MKTITWLCMSLVLLGPGPLLLAQPHPERTAVANMGLHGAVHSLRVATKFPNPDPRVNPKLSISAPLAWVLFDPEGRVAERSAIAKADGTVVSIARTRYDSAGEQTTESGEIWRTETQIGQQGQVEIHTLSNGRPFTRETRTYDELGNLIESNTQGFSRDRDVRIDSIYEDGRKAYSEVSRPDAPFQSRVLERFDRNGNLVQRTFFDSEGSAITTFSLDKGKLTSYWQRADCDCSNMVASFLDGVTYYYKTQPNGTLETTVQNHPHTRGNLELADTERLDSSGALLEKLTFGYKRDDHGNWIERTVSAWDSRSDATVLIRQDFRSITYY